MQIIETLSTPLAVIIGTAIGLAFGLIQNTAMEKNKERMAKGKMKNGFSVMPGSMSRVALLLILLAFVQFTCPIFFRGNIQWLVSAGIVIGYGWTLVKKLKKITANI